jgi:hypothetical protein
VAHTFSSSTQEAERGQGVQDQPVLLKTKQKTNKNKVVTSNDSYCQYKKNFIVLKITLHFVN